MEKDKQGNKEVGQLSREFLDQSYRTIFEAPWLRFLSPNLHRTEKPLRALINTHIFV